jgi:hypothetical protein
MFVVEKMHLSRPHFAVLNNAENAGLRGEMENVFGWARRKDGLV